MTEPVEVDFQKRATPAAPDTLRRSVMARVSRVADAPAPRPRRAPVARDLSAWTLVLAGFVVVIASWVAGARPAETWPALELVSADPAQVGLIVGVLIFAAGVFAPLRRRA